MSRNAFTTIPVFIRSLDPYNRFCLLFSSFFYVSYYSTFFSLSVICFIALPPARWYNQTTISPRPALIVPAHHARTPTTPHQPWQQRVLNDGKPDAKPQTLALVPNVYKGGSSKIFFFFLLSLFSFSLLVGMGFELWLNLLFAQL